MESTNGLDENHTLIETWLQVSLEKKPVAYELANRVRSSTVLSPRQRQLVPEVVEHALSALDLLSAGWTKRQALWVGSAARSLYESKVVASYILRSEIDADRFYQDGLIDIRDIFSSLAAQASSLGDLPDFKRLIDVLKSELAQVMATQKIAESANYLTVKKMAKQLGVAPDYDLVYQFLSKFSHSSAVTVLTRGGETWLSLILPLLAWIGLKEYQLMLADIAEKSPPLARTS